MIVAFDAARAGDLLMNDANRKAHWDTVYTTKGENEVSWFQENPAPSLELIDLARPTPESAIIDIGGGASRLVDSLVARGFNRVTVLDISEAALEAAKARLGERASLVQWIVADVTKWYPTQTFEVWHDRAAFHFLTDPVDRSAYVTRMKQAIKPGGYVIIGTFAIDGPENAAGCQSTDTTRRVLPKSSEKVSNCWSHGDTIIRPLGNPHSVSCFAFFNEPLKSVRSGQDDATSYLPRYRQYCWSAKPP